MMTADHNVFLLKSPNKDAPDPYVKALADEGFPAICVPVLDFEFVNIPDLSKSLSNPEEFSGMILTSPRAVEAVTKATNELGEGWSALLDQWKQRAIFVVGEATAREVSKLGLTPVGAESGNAEALSTIIINTPGLLSDGSRPLLFPVSALARDVIPSRMAEAGIDLHQLTIYRTVPHPHLAESLREAVQIKAPSHVVFFSPSGLDFSWDVWRHLDMDLAKLKCVAIGPTTQKALESRGLCPAVAAKPTPADLMTALKGTL